MLTLEQFNDFVSQMALHDWHYDYSDDISVWRKGNVQRTLIETTSKRHELYVRAYKAWHTYIYGSHGTAAAREQRDQTINELRAELLITA